jgi:predicted kinase
MFRRADELLSGEKGIILDATFIAQRLRRQAAAIAARHNKRFIILHPDCPQDVAVRRILNRTKENYTSNALSEQAYLNNKRDFEEVDLDDLKRLNPNLDIVHVTVDTRCDPPEGWYVTGVEKR